MPYSEWKERYQPPATEEQLARFAAAEKAKGQAKGNRERAPKAQKNLVAPLDRELRELHEPVAKLRRRQRRERGDRDLDLTARARSAV